MKKVKKGFTLVEIIIAVAILVIVMIPIGNAIIQSGKDNANSAKTVMATQLAQKNMEDIKARVSTKIDTSTGNKSAGEDLSLVAPGTTAGVTSWHDGEIASAGGDGYSEDSNLLYKKTGDVPADRAGLNSEKYLDISGGTYAAWADYYKKGSYEYIIKYAVSKQLGDTETMKNGELSDAGAVFGSSSAPLTITADGDVNINKSGSNFTIGSLGSNPIKDGSGNKYQEATLYIKDDRADKTSNVTVKFINNVFPDTFTLHCNVIDSPNLVLVGDESVKKGGYAMAIDRNDIKDYSTYNSATTTAKNLVAVYKINIEVYDKHNSDKLLASVSSKRMIKN